MPARSPLLFPLLAAALLTAAPGRAEERLGVRPGMALAQLEAVLKPRCTDLAISGEDDRFVTCRLDAEDDGAVVTATVSARDRTYYVAFREKAQGDAAAYAARLAADLGFSGEGAPCKFYDYAMLCWTGADGTVLHAAEPDAYGRFVSYLVNGTIEEEDTRP